MEVKDYIHKSLMELGLSNGEAKVYFEILNEKEADVSFLRKVTKYSVAGIYKILNSLIDKSFIYPVKKVGVRVFVAVPLSVISKKIALRGRKLSRIADKFNELNRLASVPVETQVYEENSLSDYYLNIPYKADDFIWCVGSFSAMKNFVGLEVEKEFINKRVKRGINCDALVFDYSDEASKVVGTRRSERRETKFVTDYNYPLEFTYLFGDKVVTFYKGADDKVKVLKAQSPELARAKAVQYQMLWKAIN